MQAKKQDEFAKKKDSEFIASQMKIHDRVKQAEQNKAKVDTPVHGKKDPEYETKVMRVRQPGEEDPSENEDRMNKVGAHKEKVKVAADAAKAKKKAEEAKKELDKKNAEQDKKDKATAFKAKCDAEEAMKLAEKKGKEEDHKLVMDNLKALNKK